MFDLLFERAPDFKAYTLQHGYPILIIGLVCIPIILWGRNSKTLSTKIKIGVGLAIIPILAVLSRMILTGIQGTFTLQEELPFHLCRIVAFLMPIIIIYQNKKWFGITYFAIIVGTLQAILSPDLPSGEPVFSYYVYWIMHTFLFFVPIYGIVVFGFRITKKDMITAFLYLNIYLVLTLIINYFLGSNYFYTSHKPASATPLDLMGPWPWYILVVEGIAMVLFLLAYLPFWIVGKKALYKAIS